MVQEAFINGVSTRRMEHLVKSLGIEGMSAGQVSVMAKELDDQVSWFRSWSLEREYPVIWVDALYEDIRMAVLVVLLGSLLRDVVIFCQKRPIERSLLVSRDEAWRRSGCVFLMPTRG